MNPTVANVFEHDLPGLDQVRMTAWVRGQVQGVGMRWWIRARALELGLTGWALNLQDGRVEIVAEGDRSACRQLAELARPAGTADHQVRLDRPGRIDGLVLRLSEPRGAGGSFVER